MLDLKPVFISSDAFDAPFDPGVEARAVLYPVTGYHLSRDQFDALSAAAADVGEDRATCVLTDPELRQVISPARPRVEFALAEYEAYRALTFGPIPLLGENAIMSAAGAWGVLISQEGHALIGGPRTFLDSFSRAYPRGLAADEAAFVAAWERNAASIGSETSWVGALLSHIHGGR